MKIKSGFYLDLNQRRQAITFFAVFNLLLLTALTILHLFPVGKSSFYPACTWFSLTGTYCAGCGSTRAMNAIAHGNFQDIIHYNILIVFFLPYLLYSYAMLFFSAVSGYRPLVISFKNSELYTLAVLVLLFWISRNFIPFLAPSAL